MSAESHQKRAPSTSSDAVRLVPNIVPPQAVSDRSIIDSVAGFINDVALTNTNSQSDPKDHILWVKFENLADISDFSLGEDWDVEGNLPPPLLLCIGYGSGVQVWAIPANGEAIEVMSWKHGAVKVLRILPTPFLSNNSELASDLLDQFIHKRPLMALCGDCPIANQSATQPSQQFHAVNFVSLKDGDVVKSIRFKSPIVDIVANRTSIAITFAERIAVFDARTLDDRLTVTTCYPCPGGLCPIALGDRWMAYAEKKLIPSKASAGGCFNDGVSSYTATVLNAAKSLGKGLRELTEQVAAGLTGNASNASGIGGCGTGSSTSNINADGSQPGIVTVLDIKHQIKDISPTSGTPVAINGSDPIIAHFIAHGEAVTTMSFDPSGMLLLTADRRGHDFNVYRIQPHPSGSVLAAVHHLYVLHRGDTSAKVQDISFSFDSRWVAVSSMRGTTHVFPITPYGGQPGYRTHSAPHVVNRLSRFHRSAGLSVDGRSSSPILMQEHAVHTTAYANPRLPPFPHPTVVLPLAQLRQPSSLSSASSLTSLSSPQSTQQGPKGHMRQRLQSSSEESYSKPLRVAVVFAKARSWLLEPPGLTHETPTRMNRKPVDSLFVIAGHGALIQYDLEPRHSANIPKDKVCDESPIELEVEAKAQWVLGTRSNSQVELSPPLQSDNWLIKDRVLDSNLNLDTSQIENLRTDERDDRWLSQVEIVTHAGPHRRLWMGPQFIFKTYNTPSGSSLAHIDVESVEIGASRARTTPMNMPLQPNAAARPLVPVLIESGSCSSHEPSPRLLDSFHYENTESDIIIGPESQLREDLADAMKDCATLPVGRDSGSAFDETSSPSSASSSNVTKVLKTITYHSSSIDGATLSHNNLQTVVVSIVNPQGTVTTVTNNPAQLEESFSSDNYILENCDETMFRPVVTVLSDPKQRQHGNMMNEDDLSQPVEMQTQLIVPVIDENMLEKKKKEREMEQKEKARKQEEVERAKIAKQLEEEEMKKAEMKLAMMKNEEKVEEVAPVIQKRGKKSQKYNNKKFAELEKKPVEIKQRDPSPPKAPSPPRVLIEEKIKPAETIPEVVESLQMVELRDIEEVKDNLIKKEDDGKSTQIEEIQISTVKVDDEKSMRKADDEKLTEKFEKTFEHIEDKAQVEKILNKKTTEKVVEKKTSVKDEEKKPFEKKPIEKIIDKKPIEKVVEKKPIEMVVEKKTLECVEEKKPVQRFEAKKPTQKVDDKKQEYEKVVMKETFVEVPFAEPPKSEAPKMKSFLEMMQDLKDTTSIQFKDLPGLPEIPRNKKELYKPFEAEPKTLKEKSPALVATEVKESRLSEKVDVKPELVLKKTKKAKKYPSKQEKLQSKVEEDFPMLGSPPPLEPLPIDDHRAIDNDAIMRISKHETIGDDDIEIIPHKDTFEIQECPEKVYFVDLMDDHFEKPEKPIKDKQEKFIKNEDFYDIDDDLPPLEPLESFDSNFEPLCFEETPMEKEEAPVDDQKENMKKKMSELLKDTNMVFAMCSSLKEMLDEDETTKSMGSSEIQRSTSSSLTTNTTTATFASASSNQTGEGQDSDYKSLELDMDESAPSDSIMDADYKVQAEEKQAEDPEDVSSFEATSSETDDSSKISNKAAPKFTCEDDEELRPLLQTSITSLSSPLSSTATQITTDANDTSALPDSNQKSPSSSQPTSNNGNGKRKNNKKKRR